MSLSLCINICNIERHVIVTYNNPVSGDAGSTFEFSPDITKIVFHYFDSNKLITIDGMPI